MINYKAVNQGYDVFGANMTIDSSEKVYFSNSVSVCQSCQCNCHLCRGGKALDDESLGRAEVEHELLTLLAA